MHCSQRMTLLICYKIAILTSCSDSYNITAGVTIYLAYFKLFFPQTQFSEGMLRYTVNCHPVYFIL